MEKSDREKPAGEPGKGREAVVFDFDFVHGFFVKYYL